MIFPCPAYRPMSYVHNVNHPVQKKTVGGPSRLPCSRFGFEVRSGRGSQAFCGRSTIIEEYATIRNAVRICYGKTRIRYGKWEYAMPNANPLWENANQKVTFSATESAMVNFFFLFLFSVKIMSESLQMANNKWPKIGNGNTQCGTRIRYGKWEYAMPNVNTLW